MNYRRALFTSVGCLAIGLGLARAEEQQSLTLHEAQDIALRNHPRISEADLQALASKQVITQVRAGLLPNVMFDATAVGNGGDNTRIAAGGLNNPVIYEREANGVMVSQLLTDFGRTQHLLNGSRLSSRAATANTEATREEILMDVDVAFYTALKAQSVLDVARQTVVTRKFLLDQITALTTNKLRSELDLRFADVTYQEGKLLVAQAETDLAQSYNALTTLLGEREHRVYHLIGEPGPAPKTVDSSGLVDTALSQRPDLVRLRLERDAAEQYVRAQKALNYPTVSAFGAGGLTPIRDAAHLEARYAAAGVNFSLPVFDAGLNAAKASEAEFRAKAAAESLRDAENTVIQNVRDAGLNVNYAYERLDLTLKLFENAKEALDLAQARYQFGSSSIVELSQAQLNETSAEIANTSAKYDYEIQRAILDYQIGAIR
ncbi:MAG TPA: TolC family protein [Verrucomicrobiae bacterium]|nr:TolC family protein [Verrucomicrobiae bacterium]